MAHQKVLKMVTEESQIPQGVCVACTSATVSAQELRILVSKSQEMWKKSVDSLYCMPAAVEPQVKTIYAHMTQDDLSLVIIKSRVEGNPITVIDRLKKRILNSKVKDRRSRRARTTGSCTCKCDDCGKLFPSPFHLNVHLKNSGQKTACFHCGVVLARGQELQEHLLVLHNESHYMCKECRNLFPTELELEDHKKNAHGIGTLTCLDCGRTFPRAGTFEAHSRMHAVLTCRTCGAQFSNRGCYREHRSHCEPDAKPVARTLPRCKRANIRDPAIFICDYCGKTYTCRPQLQNHIVWIHMDVRPHQCTWCGKRFYTAARLSEHCIVHTKERKFECDICGVKLVTKMAAVYHRRRHTGEKPYSCEDCGEKFISSSRRTEHVKRRHGKGKFQCNHCSANFVRSLELRKHVARQHGERLLETLVMVN